MNAPGNITGANPKIEASVATGATGGRVPAVEVDDVTVSHGKIVAVIEATLTLGQDERLSLLGPSGSGKSTLLHAIAGVVDPTHGTLKVAGRAVFENGRGLPTELRRVGIVFQEHALFPHLTVAANIAFGLSGGRRRVRSEHRDVVANMLSLVRLDTFADRYPHELSGGERQRVAIARALAPRPDVLLLDEPFASLDRSLAEELRTDLDELVRSQRVATMLVTHDPGDALALADRLAVMKAGRIVQQGSPEDVIRHPVDRVTARLLGPVTILTERQARVFGPGTPAVVDWVDEGRVVPVRPSDLSVVPIGHDSANASEATMMRCLSRTILPGVARLRLHNDEVGSVVVDHPSLLAPVAVGDDVLVSWANHQR